MEKENTFFFFSPDCSEFTPGSLKVFVSECHKARRGKH